MLINTDHAVTKEIYTPIFKSFKQLSLVDYDSVTNTKAETRCNNLGGAYSYICSADGPL